MADLLTQEKRSWNMSRIRGKDTKPELIFRSLLHKKGFRFRLHDKNLPGKPDIILPRYKTVIFVNGCFWHRHSGCKYAYNPKSRQQFWQEKFARTVSRDKEKTECLREHGWHVLTVWECELKENSEKAINRILQEITVCS